MDKCCCFQVASVFAAEKAEAAAAAERSGGAKGRRKSIMAPNTLATKFRDNLSDLMSVQTDCSAACDDVRKNNAEY